MALLTRFAFQAIADTIRTLTLDTDTRARVANAFADDLAKHNPRFDRVRFLTACGFPN